VKPALSCVNAGSRAHQCCRMLRRPTLVVVKGDMVDDPHRASPRFAADVSGGDVLGLAWDPALMREAFAHEAALSMASAADPASVGAAVTVALCGHWEHEPPCPLAPHHTSAVRDGDAVVVRILFACEPEQEGHVRELVESALASGRAPAPGEGTWQLRSCGRSDVLEAEREHVGRLVRS
jgi:hypothetical protein